MINYIKEFLSYLEVERNLSNNTISSYENDLFQFHNYLVSFFEKNDYNINEIDKKIIRNYLRHLLVNNIKKVSIGRKAAAIRSYFRFLSKRKIYPNKSVVQYYLTQRRRKNFLCLLMKNQLKK